MYSLIFTLLFLMFQPTHDQRFQEVQGNWNGAIEVYSQELKISVLFTYSDGILDGTLNIPQQHAFNLPLEVIRAEGNEVDFQFETGSGPATFYGIWSEEEQSIEGEFEQVGEQFPFSLTKAATVGTIQNTVPETELMIPTRAGSISGSLIIAGNDAPLVVLLSGSGSQGRNETIVGFGVFRELSAQLYEHGFSTFRYDDRGIGRSEGEPDATLEDLAADLTDVATYLNQQYGDQFGEMIFLGHSQGGLVATLAVQHTEPAAIVFMGVPFLRADKIINSQIRKISESQGISEEILNTNLEFQEEIYHVVRTEASWEPIEENLKRRLNEQIDQLPAQQREALGDMSAFVQSQIDRQLSTAKSRWFRSLIDHEPAEHLTGIDLPILALFGEKDMQVLPDENIEVAERLNSSGAELEIVRIAEANHLFQKANTGMPKEYGLLDQTFVDGFILAITEWVNGLSELDSSD